MVTQLKQAGRFFSCVDYVEDEYHFIIVCPVYTNFCRKFLKNITIRNHQCLNGSIV